MNRPAPSIFLPSALISGVAAVLGIWIRISWPAVAGLVLLAIELASVSRRQSAFRTKPWVAWAATAFVAGGLVFSGNRPWNFYGATCLLLNGVALLLTSRRFPGASAWKFLALSWLFGGGLIALGFSYAQNFRGAFHVALLINVALLLLCRFLFSLRPLGIQTVHTLVLLLVGLPIADLFLRPHARMDAVPDPRKKYYLYDNAQKDPGAYATWHRYYLMEFSSMLRHVYERGPSPLPGHLIPSNHAAFFQSRFYVNRKGFRGREIADDKGDAYRIVAVGESTTFGFTMNAGDRPWPELLEEMIRDRLKPSRPVEVINAGIPGFNLEQNLLRFPSQILPLRPDLILSYHGYNGFPLVEKALPPSFQSPPAYHERPLQLLADAEYRLQMVWFRRRQTAGLRPQPAAPVHPLDTEYAAAYRELIHIARTNHIRLVLANHSMAVNSRSDPRVVEFYRLMYPAVHWQIQVNEVHSEIVRQLAQENPEIGFIDTLPELDGDHDKFIDLVHFAPEGEQQMAETFFNGIRKVLEEDLAKDVKER